MKSKYVVIVDPYASGNLLPKIFQKKGVLCIAVHTKKVESKGLSASFVADDFELSIEMDGIALTELAAKLDGINVVAVLPGVETGVQLSDSIARLLAIETNIFELSEARRNKHLMQESIKKAGLNHIRGIVVDKVQDALNWVNQTTDVFPLVVKPTESGGSDGVKKCVNTTELESAIDAILGKNNFFGIYNSEALVQEYLVGIEYVVDSVSCNGIHYVTNVAKYEKELVNGAFVYKIIDYTYPLDNEISKVLIEYNGKSLDALGIRQGPSHSEIMLTDRGPIVVEIGARMHGGRIPPMLVENCVENSLLELVVDSYIDPDSFMQKIKTPQAYKAHGAGFCFINLKTGIVKSLPQLDKVNNIASMFGSHQFVKIGDQISPTHSLFTSPLWVFIANVDKHQFEKDLSFLKEVNDSQSLIDIENEEVETA